MGQQRRYPSQRDNWHPILACEEFLPGNWVMLTQYRKPYAIIRMIRRGNQVGYRVDTWATEENNRELIGFYLKLRAAAAAGHQRFLSAHSSPGARGAYSDLPAYGTGTSTHTAKANTPDRMERD